MKLFYKFLIVASIISLVPLIVYTLILLNTTAITLKNIINQNNINLVDNIVREVNDFFIEVEKRLDVARKIERTPKMTEGEKSELIFNEMSSTNMLMGIFLLDKNWKTIIGMTSSGTPYEISYNKELMKKVEKTKHIEVSNICYTSTNKPYIDIIYPIKTYTKEYLYIRIRIEYLLNRIAHYLKTEKKKSSKTIFLIDEFGSVASFPDTQIRSIDTEQLNKYQNMLAKKTFIEFTKDNRMFIENRKLNIVALSRGPGWIVLFQEPISKVYAPIIKMQMTSIVLICLTLFFAFWGAFKLAKNLTNPIETLISGVNIVAGGNLDYMIPQTSNDELATLVNAFNSMTAKLKKLQEDIKKSERLSTIGEMANILGHEIRNPLNAIVNA
ncbi:MAG: HAMP domain-containing protein, partial [Endomicrobiia bacterium]